MISTSKKVRICLLAYSLLGVIAIGVCYITDFVNNDIITWSAYVMAAVPVVFVSVLPLCFDFKYNRLASFVVISFAVIFFLYMIDYISPGAVWFSEMALPIALQIIISFWVSGFVLRFIKISKWVLSAILVAGFGGLLILSVSYRLTFILSDAAPALINIIGIFAVAVIATGLCIGGYIQHIIKGHKAVHREVKIEDLTPVDNQNLELLKRA